MNTIINVAATAGIACAIAGIIFAIQFNQEYESHRYTSDAITLEH